MVNYVTHTERLLNGDLEPLLVDLLDGLVSDHEFASLISSLRDSEELRKRACLFLCDESLLSDEIGATQHALKLVEMLSLRQSLSEHAMQANQAKASRLLPIQMLSFINANGLAVAVVALFIIFSLAAYNSLMMSKISRLHMLAVQGNNQPEIEVITKPDSTGNSSNKLQGPARIVGRVIGVQDTQWRHGQKELTFGDTLKEGQRLHIESGGLEILLANGAKITAEGPVDFEVDSLLMMELDVGKVVAAVPRTARGYTIMTPTTEVVDIGTQFGLSVDESGDTELHVFDGDVVARSLVGSVEAELIHAKENEAMGFNTVNSTPRRFAIREADFIRRLGPAISQHDYPSLPKTDDLSMWYAADMIPGARDGDVISTWRDLLIGDNKFANDARQFDSRRCPTLAIDEQGRHALRFNGWSTHLVTDPIENGESCTVFVVCMPEATSFSDAFHGGYLFKQGEAPSLELSILSDLSSRGWLWPGPDEDRVGIVQSRPIDHRQVSVVAYQYDTKKSESRLWVNGIVEARSDAPVEVRGYAQACLGSHSDLTIDAYFFGNIYEIVAYGSSLDDQSMKELNSYFVKRYKIDWEL